MFPRIPERASAVAMLLALASPAVAAPPSLFDAIMAGLAAQPDRQAAFTEEKRLSSLQMPLRSVGQLIFRHPAHLEKITAPPNAESMVVDADQLTISGPDAAPRVVPLDTHPALRALTTTIAALLAGDPARLKSFYAVDAQGALAAWRVILRPARPELAHFIRDITIDGSGAELRHFTTVQANGDSEALTIAKMP